MIAAREFSSAAEMRSHYRALNARFFPVVAKPIQVVRKVYPRILCSDMQIVADVAGRHDVMVEDIMSMRKVRHFVAARHEAIVAISAAHPKWSSRRIGKFFGCDHKLVVNVLRKTGAR